MHSYPSLYFFLLDEVRDEISRKATYECASSEPVYIKYSWYASATSETYTILCPYSNRVSLGRSTMSLQKIQVLLSSN